MTEQQIQRKIIKYLESEGHYVVKIVQATRSGIPDILSCVNGKFVGIEVKRPETVNNVSPLQLHNLCKITDTKGIAFVATSVADVERVLKDII